MSEVTTCVSTYNNLPYLKLAIDSVRSYSWDKSMSIIVHAENCTDGTDEWLKENWNKYDLEYYIDKNEQPVGIGGGMNFCAERVKTKYINFIHSDFFVSLDWDKPLYDIVSATDDPVLASSHRIEPSIFRPALQQPHTPRPGTLEVPMDIFGAYHYDFNEENFIEFAKGFAMMNDFQYPKAEGVSFMIRKDHWDHIGGNDPIFAPASYEDMDLFLRMRNEGYKFVLTSKSVVWHFGARGSHRLEENAGQTSQRQRESERKNIQLFINKWGGIPDHDEFGMIKGVRK